MNRHPPRIVAALCALLFASAAGADTTLSYTVLYLGKKAGMTPGEAIRIATQDAARLTGLDGDPTRNISDIRRVSLVLKGGVGYAPADLYESFGIRRFAEPPQITRPGGQ